MADGTVVPIKIVASFEDDMLRILCVASVVSLILGVATEGW